MNREKKFAYRFFTKVIGENDFGCPQPRTKAELMNCLKNNSELFYVILLARVTRRPKLSINEFLYLISLFDDAGFDFSAFFRQERKFLGKSFPQHMKYSRNDYEENLWKTIGEINTFLEEKRVLAEQLRINRLREIHDVAFPRFSEEIPEIIGSYDEKQKFKMSKRKSR